MNKTCKKCRFYLPKLTGCLGSPYGNRAAEIEKVKNALSYGNCDDFKKDDKYLDR